MIIRVASVSSSSFKPCSSLEQISRAAATLEGEGERRHERPRQPANKRDNSLSRLPSNRSAAGRRGPKRRTGPGHERVPILSRREHQSGRSSREGAWLSVVPWLCQCQLSVALVDSPCYSDGTLWIAADLCSSIFLENRAPVYVCVSCLPDRNLRVMVVLILLFFLFIFFLWWIFPRCVRRRSVRVPRRAKQRITVRCQSEIPKFWVKKNRKK